MQKILEIFDKISGIQKISMPKLIKTITASIYKKSGKALLTLSTRSELLTTAIIDAGANQNPYAAGILYRAQIEHYLKFFYIFLYLTKEKNDNAGHDYYTFLRQHEDKRHFNKIISMSKKIDPDNNQFSAVSFANASNSSIDQKAKQFSVDSILIYINENFKGIIGKLPVEKIIPQYNDLSSCVHGGPFAEKVLQSMKGGHTIFPQESIKMSLTMVKNLYFLGKILDKQHNHNYLKIEELLSSLK